jgi:hypothetical protein
MAKRFLWKIWLRPNLLTKEVDISTVGNTLRNENIARQIVKEREIRYDTILTPCWADRRCRTATYTLRCADPVFDPKTHKITVDVFQYGKR